MKITTFIYSFLLVVLFTTQISAQSIGDKVYFDKSGKVVTASQSYYYRIKTDAPNSYKSFYTNGGAVYFEGNMLKADDNSEQDNVYTGTCTWYYKNGNKKAVREFNSEGIENGTSTYYYESGKIWKEIKLKNGKVDGNNFKEYTEDGQVSQIFEDTFDSNANDWDLYTSDKSSAQLINGSLKLTSFVQGGTSRYISIGPASGHDFSIEATINIDKLPVGEKAGIIYGFKDWQNYNFFLITQSSIYIGFIYEGITNIESEGMFSGDIKSNGINTLKIISLGHKNIFSINGAMQFKSDKSMSTGSNVGFALSGKSSISVENIIVKDLDYKSATLNKDDRDVKASGSGLIISSNGYIVTNNHVVNTANAIKVEIIKNGLSKTYNAIALQKDKENDLAIIKINDESFKELGELPYSFKNGAGADVGATVFTIGFPEALSGMGKEPKFTDGKVSSKTGYNGALNTYQTTVPLQPGNSGSPLFNEKGELVGINNSKIMDNDNVSYAINLNFLRNLIDLLPDQITLPAGTTVNNLTLPEKIKVLSEYVVLIKIL